MEGKRERERPGGGGRFERVCWNGLLKSIWRDRHVCRFNQAGKLKFLLWRWRCPKKLCGISVLGYGLCFFGLVSLPFDGWAVHVFSFIGLKWASCGHMCCLLNYFVFGKKIISFFLVNKFSISWNIFQSNIKFFKKFLSIKMKLIFLK